MVHGPEDTVAFRLWPPVAIGAPMLAGWLATLLRVTRSTSAGGGSRSAGRYRLSRNPLYVGLLALYLALALLAPTCWGLVLFPAAVLLIRWGAIRPEERFLHQRFGAQYDDYARRVRRWL